MIDIQTLITQADEEVHNNSPIVEVRKERRSPTITKWFIEITYFYGKPNQFTDEYDITSEYKSLIYMLSTVEKGSNLGIHDASKLYSMYKPKIREIGKTLNGMAGIWTLYGTYSLVYNYNRQYSILIDECWKNIGLWK